MNILVAVDLRDRPSTVVSHALQWATRLDGRLHLRSVHAEPEDRIGLALDPDPEAEWRRMLPEEHRLLAEVASAIPDALAGRHELVPGPPVPALVEAAEGFDLTIVGTHGRRHLELLAEGSVAAHVVRMVTQPVLVVPLVEPGGLPQPLKIMVGVESLDTSWASARLACAWFGDGIDLHVVHVEPDQPWAEAPAWRARLDEAGISATVHEARGAATADSLAAVADQLSPDLVVVRTHGRTGVSRLVQGSVSERLLRLVHRPVLVLA